MTKHLTLLLFIGLAFWSCEEKSKTRIEEKIIEIYEDGKTKYVMVYKVKDENRVLYKKRTYHKNGLINIDYDVDAIGKPNGVYSEFYENGKPKIMGSYSIIGSNEVKNGQWMWYNESGNIDKIEDYLNGVKQ